MNVIRKKCDWSFEGRLLTPGGGVKWFHGVSSPVIMGDEIILNGVFIDITKRKETRILLEHELAVNSALADLSQSMISTPDDINLIANLVLDKARDFTGSTHGYISVFQSDTQTNIIHASTGLINRDLALFGDNKIILPAIFNKKAFTSLDVNYNRLKPFFINNLPAVNCLDPGVEQRIINKFLFVPVLFANRFIGQICLANPGKEYTGSDLDLIKRLADLYALALVRITGMQEKLKLETQLRQAQKMEAIGTLAGGIAHDFNNILGAILGYAELAIENEPPDSPVTKNLNMILKAGLRAKDLIKQILAFSRQANTKAVPFNPATIMKETLKILRASIPATIMIQIDIDPNPGIIFADPYQFEQVFINLCTNAYQAMEDTGGILNIFLKTAELNTSDFRYEPGIKSGNYVRLVVRDTGPGIPPKIKNQIFEPYFTTKEIGKGTGMGLAIVHGIVKSFGGIIKLSSETGKGATFEIYFPVIDEPEQIILNKNQQIPLGKEHVLFIDDEKMLVELGNKILKSLGYKVTACKSSREALRLFRKKPDRFDLVITDQTMPEMTGSELSIKILEIRPDMPIILCTGYSTLISNEKVKAAGIKECIQKPISKGDMARVIRKVLNL